MDSFNSQSPTNSPDDAALAVPDCLIHDLFVRQAARNPHRPAVISPARTLSYGELLSLSRGWAARLRVLGARPNTLVAIVMERGWEQIVAALAVLQAGAAYLPIDAAVPKERLAFLLENGDVEVVLTQSSVASRLQWPDRVVRLAVDTDSPGFDGLDTLDFSQSADDLAYVLYTSGSTGTPKGAMIAHRGLVNCILDTNRTFGIGPEDRVLAVTALHHDMSVFDIFGLLAAGGAIAMPEPAAVRAPDRWVELIDRERITVWNSVPGFMEMLLEYAAAQKLRLTGRLRLAFLGGDWIPLTAPGRIHTHFADVQVVSVGGPTETTVWNIWYPVLKVDPAWKSIPYGHPIANTQYHVLNESLQDCPIDYPGELWCAGVGLMRGYWRNEEQTSERFAIHPRTGQRIYRTGDRGRLRADGEIEFLGRSDSQIKICGQRIELGEIESNLNQYPGLKQAAVTTILSNGQKRLVGYLVPDGHAEVVSQDVRAFLENRLPQCMIPSTFVRLSSLPLNSNGKVDRSALPAPEAPSAEPAPAVASSDGNQLEESISEVWRRVLGVDRMGATDNFFDLGGNSLLLVRAHAELQQRLERTLPVTDLFEFPSVRALGNHLNRQAPTRLAVAGLDERANKQRSAMALRRRAGART